ncbi:hypothetical protein TREPR_0694 [Treponema primitia ZAS-2]|uniref:Uncharacterized protein n=1 Tax=Treponema primitia (strain ATCC BAA-887 / DSM 12427 / ZAS-2) TaxID=545694 RepID=F5YJZ5_TREPZ|nr:hypothetical protein [Treponema primitia]AEF86611.1 hypothetical protein TREPR_0694 [Treponema primitia ZAS-2]
MSADQREGKAPWMALEANTPAWKPVAGCVGLEGLRRNPESPLSEKS